jgi:hypothetical protein
MKDLITGVMDAHRLRDVSVSHRARATLCLCQSVDGFLYYLLS